MKSFENPAELLHRIGMSPKYKGYAYLKFILHLTRKDPALVHGLSQRLYPMVTEQFRVGQGSVERNLRFLIKKSWETDRGAMHALFEDYGIRWTPTNQECISILTELLSENKVPLYVQLRMW